MGAEVLDRQSLQGMRGVPVLLDSLLAPWNLHLCPPLPPIPLQTTPLLSHPPLPLHLGCGDPYSEPGFRAASCPSSSQLLSTEMRSRSSLDLSDPFCPMGGLGWRPFWR